MLTEIKNQPIVFDESIGICPQGSWDYAQQILTTDCAEWQMLNGVCDWSKQVIDDNDFNNPGTNWTYGSGWLFQGGSDPSAFKQAGIISSLSQADCFVVGRRYELTINVKSLQLAAGSEGFVITDGVQVVGNVVSSGISKYYFTAQGSSVTLTPSDANDQGTFSSIGALEQATNIILTVANTSTGTIIDSFNPLNNPTLFDYVKDRVNFKLCWDNVAGLGSTGCYEIGICDPCINTNGQNGFHDNTMTDASFWVFSSLGNWNTPTIGAAGESSFSGLGSTTTTDLNAMTWEVDGISSGTSVDYEYTLNVWSNSVQTTFQVYIGGVNVASHSVATAGTAEEFTGTISAGAGGKFEIVITSGNDSATYTASVISFDWYLSNDSDYSPDMTTNKFNILDANECSILINANNHQDAMGFVWDEGNFNPRLRLGGRLLPPDDPFTVERSTHVDSEGEAFNVYFSRRELKVLAIHNEPIFIHRFLSLLLGMGHFYLNDVEYFVEEDGYPAITWNRDRTLGKAQILMSAKVEDIEAVRSQADTKGGTQVSDNLRITTENETRLTTDGAERITTD